MDPKWVKTYFREGEAYLKLKDYGEAAASFWEGLRLEPKNQTFKKKFQECVKIGKKIN